jgi:hypothetical protein
MRHWRFGLAGWPRGITANRSGPVSPEHVARASVDRASSTNKIEATLLEGLALLGNTPGRRMLPKRTGRGAIPLAGQRTDFLHAPEHHVFPSVSTYAQDRTSIPSTRLADTQAVIEAKSSPGRASSRAERRRYVVSCS